MRKRHFFMKKIIGLVLAGSMLCSAWNVQAFAAEILHDQISTEIVTKGVTYEKNHRFTTEGWQDIHVLKIDLNDPNLVFQPLESQTEYGLKETLLKMVEDTGAVAAVNGDFFGMKGEYSASFGPVVRDGNIISAGTDRNLDKNEYSTFFIDKEGNPFIDFFRIQADFYAGEYGHLELASFNKITEMKYPIYFDKNAAASTADLDARFADLVKFTVQNDTITAISQKGETVNTPEDGYLIIISGEYYNDLWEYFVEGQTTRLDIRATLDLNTIQTAISGIGRILVDGEKPEDAGLLIKGRQPRTALGITQDSSTLILMVVDGRGDSIGATNEEMVWLMREYGAYNAMHFDGGGSSTMVAKTIEQQATEVKNTVSEGTQRKIINGLGVFNNAPISELSQIELKVENDRAFINNSITLSPKGYDEYFHEIALDESQIMYSLEQGEGVFHGNSFIPTVEGDIQINMAYQDKTATATIKAMKIASIEITPNEIYLLPNENTPLQIKGISTNGYTADVSNDVQYTVSGEIGNVDENGIFTASAVPSKGYITASVGENISCAVPVIVWQQPEENIELPWTPEPTKLYDSHQQQIQYAEDGAIYVNIVGKVTSATAEPEIYTAEQSKVKNAVESNANFAVYGGKTDITPSIDTIQWNGEYQFQNKNGVSVVMMTAAQGGFRVTNPAQWISFQNDIVQAGNQAVVIVMDKTPSVFEDALETMLFSSVLSELEQQSKTIFVVSASGQKCWSSIKDGIHYINLPDLFLEDGSVNTDFSILKLRIVGEEITYEMSKIA
ncbi:phosphodiester glycosidase family protein [Clostridium sp. MD294]|uniref:phosphodiester glycosidase family protein n=1 Tax=Clostridium sp. MD294 TaxID=97138 RepID=UPI0002CA0DBB|nr:phosphodiester glycosidase family protein [Clostridium sp. MD294]USF29925.1 hypothetical protein C820_001345 [Clostridium sp. MD294]